MTARVSISILLALGLSAGAAFAQRRGGRGPQGPVRRDLVRPAPQQQAPPAQRQEQQRPPQAQPEGNNQPGFRLHGPGPHMGDWLRKREGMSPQQRLQDLEKDPTYQRLSPQRQERLRNQLQNFDNLPQQRQQQILNRMDVFEHLPPDQQQRARSLFQQFRDLPQDRRQELNRGFRDLRDLSPQDRQKALDSDDYKSRFSDQERDILRGMSDMGLTPGRPSPPSNPQN
ncbi:MAG TPA: DUF3106 domain-containing protein [Terriglobales bacterium]|nr:DUF3106 domain-containing protein [Terriglobales bacterium]